MNQNDLEILAKGVAPVIRDLLEAKTRPLEKRIEWLEAKIATIEAEVTDQAARLSVEAGNG